MLRTVHTFCYPSEKGIRTGFKLVSEEWILSCACYAILEHLLQWVELVDQRCSAKQRWGREGFSRYGRRKRFLLHPENWLVPNNSIVNAGSIGKKVVHMTVWTSRKSVLVNTWSSVEGHPMQSPAWSNDAKVKVMLLAISSIDWGTAQSITQMQVNDLCSIYGNGQQLLAT